MKSAKSWANPARGCTEVGAGTLTGADKAKGGGGAPAVGLIISA